jgi:hypothetical protein
MAGRKPKKGLDWFPHDVGYAGDEDIEILIANYGQDGYAYPLHMYELAYKTRNGELDISEAEKRQVYAKACLVPLEKWEAMTQTALKYNIWDPHAYTERRVLTSDRIKDQMAPVLEKREKAKQSYNKKGKAETDDISASEKQTSQDRNGQSKADKSKITEKEYVSSPEALRLSEVLVEQILTNNPENRELRNGKKEDTKKRWAKDIDRMIRLDGRSPDSILKIILWAHKDSFWYKNILSGAKLREKFDRLTLDMASKGGGRSGFNGRYGKPGYDPDELRAIKERRQAEGQQQETEAHSGTSENA